MRTMLPTLMIVGTLVMSTAHADGVHMLHRVDLSTPAKVEASSRATQAARGLIRSDYQAALDAAQAGLKVKPGDPWLLYNEGVALVGLDRLDDALPVLRQAETNFDPADTFGRSVAIYQRAISLEQAGRCDEARPEYQRYADLVQPQDKRMARDAQTFANLCVRRVSGAGPAPATQPAVGHRHH
jgi:tetratricopeptide (TPR) repeat protein